YIIGGSAIIDSCRSGNTGGGAKQVYGLTTDVDNIIVTSCSFANNVTGSIKPTVPPALSQLIGHVPPRNTLYLLKGSATLHPANLALGAADNTDVTVNGAVLGDKVVGVSFSLDLNGVVMYAYVSNNDTVHVIFSNQFGANPTNLASGTISVIVAKS